MFKLLEEILVSMRKLLFLLFIGFAVPANAAPIYLTCSYLDEKNVTWSYDVTIKPGSDRGTIAEYYNGKVLSTKKLSQFISDTAYTLQEVVPGRSFTTNRTFEVDRVNGDFVKKFWFSNSGLSPQRGFTYTGRCDKKKPVKTMF